MRQNRATRVKGNSGIVVLGAPMHRSGSSMLWRIIEAMGVSVGDRLLGPNEFNPFGHFEDADFFELNVAMLRAAGGNWIEPPTGFELQRVAPWFIPRMRWLIDWKASHYERWSFKDPRNCLTGRYYWPLLPDPKVVLVTERDRVKIADSLDRRARAVGYPAAEDLDAKPTLWHRLISRYEQDRRVLIKMAGKDRVHYVKMENLWESPQAALPELEKLAEVIGGNPIAGLQMIQFRGLEDNQEAG